jgi:hypothetical protein
MEAADSSETSEQILLRVCFKNSGTTHRENSAPACSRSSALVVMSRLVAANLLLWTRGEWRGGSGGVGLHDTKVSSDTDANPDNTILSVYVTSVKHLERTEARSEDR